MITLANVQTLPYLVPRKVGGYAPISVTVLQVEFVACCELDMVCGLVSAVALVGMLCAVARAQPGILPLPFPPRAIEADGECPTAQQRDSELASIDSDIYSMLDSVVSPCGVGWTRVVFLNTSDPSMTCPSEWEQLNHAELDGCGRREHICCGTCNSVSYSTGIEYSEVCGRIIGHHFGGTDGLAAFTPGVDDIDSQYVDGVSVTHGSPRMHIWTFVASLAEQDSSTPILCPCDGGDPDIPPFVGDNYFCEAGRDVFSGADFGTDPLWDGDGCGAGSSCCTFNSPPWFSVTLPAPTIDDIEIRVCGDEGTSDENVYMELIEIYVR